MIAIASARRRPTIGHVSLEFAPGLRGTTLTRSHLSAPLKIVRPFAIDGGRAVVQILTLGPGLCGGDTLTIDVAVQPGARAVVVMQAASRILGMSDGAKATQSVNLFVAAGGQLEYYPGLTIPFADSSLSQQIHVSAEPGARVGVLESWAMGRHSRGEHLGFRHLSSRTVVTIGGQPVFADALEIEPAAVGAAATGILEDHQYLASGFWHGVPAAATIAIPPSPNMVAFGRCTTHDDVFLRALAHDGYDMAATQQSAVAIIDSAWGFEPIPLRRFIL